MRRYAQVCVQVCAQVCHCVQLVGNIHLWAYTHTHAHYTHTHARTHTLTHTHTHTHTHIHTPMQMSNPSFVACFSVASVCFWFLEGTLDRISTDLPELLTVLKTTLAVDSIKDSCHLHAIKVVLKERKCGIRGETGIDSQHVKQLLLLYKVTKYIFVAQSQHRSCYIYKSKSNQKKCTYQGVQWFRAWGIHCINAWSVQVGIHLPVKQPFSCEKQRVKRRMNTQAIMRTWIRQ